ncbi:AraC family transcriptional regulator [Serratia sp. BW106]|uniref:cupin domain-containing protein n=1 Tax=Serratia sp. BW106 TaxID=1884636 RepID=UPI000BFFCE63|nr:AraC family transcriptional regulator [Serratia sp. BW106]
MDTLSQLLSLSQTQVSLDVRCLLDGAFSIPHEIMCPGEAAFHFLLSGECQLRLSKDLTLKMNAGDFVLLPHGSAHELLNVTKDTHSVRKITRDIRIQAGKSLPIKCNQDAANLADVDLLCGRFVFTRGAGTLLMQSLPQVLHVCLRDSSGVDQLEALISLLRTETDDAQPGAHSIVNTLGQVLLIFALRTYSQGTNISPNLLALAADRRLGPSIQAILESPAQPWTISSLGKMVAMSRATYARQFQDRSGMTVGGFLTQIRIMRACELLSNTALGQADIGEAVGYQSEAAFGKAFHKIMGQTPGRWRRGQRMGS